MHTNISIENGSHKIKFYYDFEHLDKIENIPELILILIIILQKNHYII